MSIDKKILAVAPQTDMPSLWCQNFAQSLLKIETKLGITLDVEPRYDDRCLWIKILSSETYSKDSELNLDIVGFDYHEELEKIYLITVVGFRNYWYNVALYKKLRSHPNYIADIENNYGNSYRFERQFRFNKIRATFYATIKSYNTFCDYLTAVGNVVYSNKMTPSDCIGILNKLGVTTGDAIDKLRRFHYKEYNWLEYLHIVSKTPINCKGFLEKAPATMAEFEKQIEQHIRGMILIDKIYNAKCYSNLITDD